MSVRMCCHRTLALNKQINLFNINIYSVKYFSNNNNIPTSNIKKASRDDILQNKFKSFIENLILSVYHEKNEVLSKERLLHSNMPEQLQELRSLCISNLRIATDFTPPGSGQDFKIKLVRREGGQQAMPSGGWRRGMLVSLQLEDGARPEARLEGWRMVDGILEEVTSAWLVVSLQTSQGWVLDGVLGRRSSPSLNIKVVKRSEEKLYSNSIKQLKRLQKYKLSERCVPARLIFGHILGVETGESAGPAEDRQDVLTVFNQSLLRDQSKMRALELASQRPPLVLLQGPPGGSSRTTSHFENIKIITITIPLQY